MTVLPIYQLFLCSGCGDKPTIDEGVKDVFTVLWNEVIDVPEDSTIEIPSQLSMAWGGGSVLDIPHLYLVLAAAEACRSSTGE